VLHAPAAAQPAHGVEDRAGGSADWLTVGPAGAGNTSYGAWAYAASLAGSGGDKTWRVTLGAPGTFEARLFLNNGYTRAATSPAFSVGP
jgi:hypothetical protein